MTTMLEKLIEAIEDSGPVGCCSIDTKKAREIARAVLLSVREADALMIESGERAAWDEDNSMPAVRAMQKAFTAMIDAILQQDTANHG